METRGILREFSTEFDMLHRVLDLLAVAVGGWLAYIVVFHDIEVGPRYVHAILLSLIFSIFIFRSFALYRSWRGVSIVTELQQVFLAWSGVFAALICLAFLIKQGETYSRLWTGEWWLITFGLMIATRVAGRMVLRYLRSVGFNFRRVAIVGATKLSAYVIQQLRDAPWTGFQVVGLFDEKANAPHVGTYHGVPVLGGLPDIEGYMAHNDLDQVWVCLPLCAENQMKQLMEQLQYSTVDIRFVPDIYSFQLLNHSISEVAGLPIISLSSTPLEGWNRVIKALEDRLLALLILLLISPLLAIIAVGVKLSSPGPILFRQKRHGWDGRLIEVWKFRSMKLHTENDGTVTQATKNDPRLTRFGSFLRKTSLDELPQFFNVLQGRMSIVGPRPHAIEHNELYKHQVERYMQRHKVKPGITGWAQINGYRGETDTLDKMKKRVEYDLYYIENWSLLLDLKIIFLTLFRGFVDKNAY